jgi:hypothetical protein
MPDKPPKLYLDTETCGLHSMMVLLQYAVEDGPIALYEVWRRPIRETLALIEWICQHTVVGFNLSFDWFHVVKVYTIFRLCDPDWIPEEHIDEIAMLEPQGQDGPCVKPAAVLDLMLHSRKGPYQSLMAREDVRIKRVPTALAYALARELEARVQFDNIYFAKSADPEAPKWQVFDRHDSFGDLDTEFKDVVLKFNPAGGLKFLAEHALKLKPKYHYADVEPPPVWRPCELGYAPTALAVSSPDKGWAIETDDGEGNGKKVTKYAWPGVIRKFIDHWATRQDARDYANDDIVYTRALDKHFGCPEPGDNDSTLTCMVAAVRWHGFTINREGISGLRAKAQAVMAASPVNIHKPSEVRAYITAVMNDTEKLILEESTKKANLEAISKWGIGKMCPTCKGKGYLGEEKTNICPDCKGVCFAGEPEPCGECEGTVPSQTLTAFGLDRGASVDTVHATYRHLAKTHHPDHGGNAEEFKRVQEAYEAMINRPQCHRCGGTGFLKVGWHPAAVRAKEILAVKFAAKEIELYDKLLLSGKFHASFVVIGALSSRMAGADGLNAQGIKHTKEVRQMFPLAWEGYLLCGGDFSSFEVTIADAVCNDEALRAELIAGRKIHALFGMAIFPGTTYEEVKSSDGSTTNDMYTKGKQGFFGTMLYGGDHSTLVNRLGISEEVAKTAIENFGSRFVGVKRWRKRVADSFCSMTQPAGIGTKVVWKEPADYAETMLGFRRYFTLENRIARAIFDLARNTPKHWKDCKVKVVRRDRVQTAGGAVSSALYGAAFSMQAANMRAAANHEIQSPGAEITKHVQRKIWDLQPVGVNEWHVAPMNIHDEIMCVTRPDAVQSVAQVVRDSVEHFRPYVPLIGMDWNEEMANWAEKKSGTIKIRAPEMMK